MKSGMRGISRLVGLILCTGCMGAPMAAPKLERWGGGFYGQGDQERQKARAVYFDPYPQNDIGPPVVGGRPPGFGSPLPEAKRNKLDPKDRFNF
ncbi:MAG: hypothetical protein ACK5YR_22265 [Pirellula sp.]|jgi:hypothetical protein